MTTTAIHQRAGVRGVRLRVRQPIDVGRLILVPVFALLLTLNLLSVPHTLRSRHGVGAAVALGVSALTVAFYLLVLWAYLRRGPASATSRSLLERSAAVVATGLPLLLPLVVGVGSRVVLDLVAGALMLAGLSLSVLALRALGRSISVIPQARGLAARGPYRWVRHPLYVGELVTVLGIVVRDPRPSGIALWLVLVTLQAYRAGAEERLLIDNVPGYRGYARGTARFVPWMY